MINTDPEQKKSIRTNQMSQTFFREWAKGPAPPPRIFRRIWPNGRLYAELQAPLFQFSYIGMFAIMLFGR